MFCKCRRKKKEKKQADPVVEEVLLDVNEQIDEPQIPVVSVESETTTTADSESYKEEIPK